MPQNLEIKARIQGFAVAQSVCEQIGAQYVGRWKQVDTYFQVRRGRLKLREIENSLSELIRYEREEHSNLRTSNFEIFTCEHGSSLKKILGDAIGVRAVVEKTRTLYLYADTRIHLDDVQGIGMFLEFEVPVRITSRDAEETMEFLIQKFGIKQEDYFLNSYVDLLEKEGKEVS